MIGRHRHTGWMQHLGMDLIEATLLSEGITQGLKVAIRRERPLRADGTRASGFSFPSGHASVTFAAATVLGRPLSGVATLLTGIGPRLARRRRGGPVAPLLRVTALPLPHCSRCYTR